MDYEKKYKEALERAKKKVEESTVIYGKNCAAVQLIQEVFPELRESEDERIRKDLMNTIRHAAGDNGVHIDDELERRYLAWLEKQKEQKPAEWSEEDECIRKAILGFLNPDKGGTKYSSYAELVKWSDWLKSLRPSWKPSEEQMSMLLAVINDPNNTGSESCHLALISLYEQLKKLM